MRWSLLLFLAGCSGVLADCPNQTVPGRTCKEHCECGAVHCENATAGVPDLDETCWLKDPPWWSEANDTYGRKMVEGAFEACCIAKADCSPRCTIAEEAIANDFFLIVDNFTEGMTVADVGGKIHRDDICHDLFRWELTGDAENEMNICLCIKAGLEAAIADNSSDVMVDYEDAVNDLSQLDCRMVKGSVHTVKEITELCMGTSARDDPTFNTGTEKIKFWLPNNQFTPLLNWETAKGEPSVLLGETFSLDGARGLAPEDNSDRNIQWFKAFAITIANDTVLRVTSHYLKKSHSTAALLPGQAADMQSFVHVELDGETLFSQEPDETPVDHVSQDGSVRVTMQEFPERHIGDERSERVTVKTPKMEFILWSNKAGKFKNHKEQIKYAHLNFHMNGPFPAGVKGLFAEMRGTTPVTEASKQYLKLRDDEIVKMEVGKHRRKPR